MLSLPRVVVRQVVVRHSVDQGSTVVTVLPVALWPQVTNMTLSGRSGLKARYDFDLALRQEQIDSRSA